MQDDDTTVFSFGERADELMTALSATGLRGMSAAQADLVVEMGKLLDFAARRFSFVARLPGPQARALISKAANHALAMRCHNATLRGVAGAEMIEDLCDIAMGRYIIEKPAVVEIVVEPEEPGMTVEEAMTMVKATSQRHFAALLECGSSTIKYWKNNGRIANWAKVKVETLYRGMGVAA